MRVESDRRALCWLALCLWNLVFSLDCTSIATALPSIAHDLSANSNQAFWAGTAFLLCSAAFQPFFTSLSGAIGRRSVILISLALLAAGSCICGWGNTIETMLAGRSVQGIGGGGLFALTYVLMADLSTIQDRGKWMGLLGLIWTVGTCLGPVLGGVFTQNSTWRWIFWINLPVCFACLIAVLFGLSSRTTTRKSAMEGLRKMDWIGSISFMLSLTSFLIAISWGGSLFEWTSPATLVPLIGGVSGLALWLLYELYVAKNPMIPIDPILSDRTAIICYLGTVVIGIGMYAITFFIPLYFQAVRGYTPIMSGVALLPMAVLAGPSASISGVLIAKLGRIKPFTIAAWIIFAIGTGLLTLLRPDTPVVHWIFLLAPVGLGLGMLFSPLALATQAAVENNAATSSLSTEELSKNKAVAAGLNPFFRAIGQAFGITIAQSAFTNELRKRIGDAAARDAAGMTDVIRALPLGSPARTKLNADFTDSLRVIWFIVLGFACLWVFVSLFTVENGASRSGGHGAGACVDVERASRSCSASSLESDSRAIRELSEKKEAAERVCVQEV